jgi:hypothetical protein
MRLFGVWINKKTVGVDVLKLYELDEAGEVE